MKWLKDKYLDIFNAVRLGKMYVGNSRNLGFM